MIMKVTDLMVGDWVNVTTTNQPRKIEGTNDLLFHDDYDPIPLTDDILVKNGWDFTKMHYAVHCKEDKNHDVELSKHKDGFYWTINWDEYDILRIDYVHTLQHLLRLYGIEKDRSRGGC